MIKESGGEQEQAPMMASRVWFMTAEDLFPAGKVPKMPKTAKICHKLVNNAGNCQKLLETINIIYLVDDVRILLGQYSCSLTCNQYVQLTTISRDFRLELR